MNDLDDELGQLPSPISTEREALPPKDETSGQKNARERRETVERAFTKSERLQVERETRAAKKEGKEPVTSAVKQEDDRLRRETVERAAKSLENNITPKELTSEELRKLRETIRQRRPEADLGQLAKLGLEWGPKFEKDPVAAREELMRSYLAVMPEIMGKTKEVKYEPGIRGSLQRAADDRRDHEQLAEFIETHGKDYPRMLQQLHAFDEAMVADPVGMSARIAASYGALEQSQAPQQAQPPQQPQRPPHEERMLQAVTTDLEQVIASGQYPGMEDENFQNVVADVLMDMPKGGDLGQKLHAAYHHVKTHMDAHHARIAEQERGRQAVERAQTRAREEVQRARKGSKSISGGKSLSPPASSSGNGVRASLAKAQEIMK